MATAMRKVIFLDIDGVLLPFPDRRGVSEKENSLFPENTMTALRFVFEETSKSAVASSGVGNISKVEWVLSSTWRVQASFVEQIEDSLHSFGIPLKFSSITDPALHSERQWEIFDWLDKQNLVEREESGQSLIPKAVWLALDDEELIRGEANEKYSRHFEGRSILTESSEGLTMHDANRALKLWTRQLQISSLAAS